MTDKLRINSFGRSAAHDKAVAEGLYAAENLEVEHAATQSSKQQMQELVDGVWQVVHTNADNVFWWSEDNGADLLIVSSVPGHPGQNFVVRPEIKSYEDLRGKPIAVDAAESGFVTPLRVLLKEHGLAEEGKDHRFVEVGNTQFRIDAMRAGSCVGGMIGEGQTGELVAEGCRVLDSINRLYTRYASIAVTRRAWAVENRELLVRYLRAYLRALGKTPEFEWEGLREMMETRRQVGLLRGPVDPKRFATQEYYDTAAATV